MQHCPDIHYNLSIHYVNQSIKVAPCCIAEHNLVTDPEKIIDHPRLIELRDLNKQGILTSDCGSCIKLEQAGGRSRRIAQQENYKNYKKTGIRSLDIHLGNLCNQKCVICGPHDSTSWHKDAETLGIPILDEYRYNKREQYNLSWLANLPNLEMIHFWGGEPLMDTAHLEFCKQLNKNNVLNNCRLLYNTNGSYTINEETIDIWKKAHLVEIYFSIDDIQDRFEYQRYPGKWSVLIDTLKWFRDMPITNHLFYVNATWSMLNVFYLPELIEWQKQNFSDNRFGDSVQLLFNRAVGKMELTSLNSKQYSALEQKFSDYCELDFILNMIEIDDSVDHSSQINFITQLDKLRDNSYKNTHNEWAKLLGL